MKVVNNHKNFAVVALLILLIASKITAAKDFSENLVSGGISRSLVVHVSGNTVAQNLPLVIVLHGDGGSGSGIKSYSGFDAVADDKNFMVAYPDAINGTWNRYADDLPGDAGLNNPNAPDDVVFISDLIDYLCSKYQINSQKVYVTGHSAGGFLAYFLALSLPNKIAAFAPVAASLWGDNNFITNKLSNGFSPVPIFHVHGDADQTVDYPDKNFTPNAWEEWPLSNFSNVSCNENTYNPSNVFPIGASTQLIIFCGNATASKEVVLIRIVGGGHSWPSETDFNAAHSIYSFFEDYSLTTTCATLGLENSIQSQSITAYPNPVYESLFLMLDHLSNEKATIFNAQGAVVLKDVKVNEQTPINVNTLPSGIYFIRTTHHYLRFLKQ